LLFTTTDHVESKSKDSSLGGTREREPQEADIHVGPKFVDSEGCEIVDPCNQSVAIDLIESLSLDEFTGLKILSQQQQQQRRRRQQQQNHTTTSESSHDSNHLRHLSLDFPPLFSRRDLSRNDDSWSAVITDYLRETISNDNYNDDDNDECGSIHSFDSLEYYDRKGMLLVPLKTRKEN
jgi:hypothetical protein